MHIAISQVVDIETLRKNPEMVSKFGMVLKQVNYILSEYGYELINIVPEGMTEAFELGYVDLVTRELYEEQKDFPLELQIAISRVNTLDIEVEGDSFGAVSFARDDIDEEFVYQTYGWAEELTNMWGLASRSSNISLKQIRLALESVSGVVAGATVQYIVYNKGIPKLDTTIIKNLEAFTKLCAHLSDEGVEVINLVINKPIPKTKTTTSMSYPVPPSKYVNVRIMS